MPKSTSNSFCAKATLLRSRNAITYINSRNGSSRLKTSLLAISLRSCRRCAAVVGSDIGLLDPLMGGSRASIHSVHVFAAVDLNGRSAEVAGAVRKQKRDRGGNLVRPADPAKGDPRTHRRLA